MPQSRNAFLASLSSDDYSALQPHLRELSLPQAAVLFRAGEPITTIVMPHSGIISLVVDIEGGPSVECAMVGRDGIAGAAAVAHGGPSLVTAVVQAAVTGAFIEPARLRERADESPSCRAVLHRYELLIEAQSQQSAACNATHLLQARLARWLLRCRDLLESDDMSLTQEYIGQMLGVKRTTVTLTAQALQTTGIIRYSRGRIRILDADRLRLAACECYDAVKSYSETLIGTGGGENNASARMPAPADSPASASP